MENFNISNEQDRPNVGTKIRHLEATIYHASSGWKEVKFVTLIFTDRNEKYELTKVYAVEYGQEVVFSKNNNEIILPD